MNPFSYHRAEDAPAAVRQAAGASAARYLGGGTNLVDLMRETIERPEALIDVTGLPRTITRSAEGGLIVGAAVTNTALAGDAFVREHYPLLSRAILAGASGQIRNMATLGGNILQRTRCLYFYDQASRCNKRAPGAGCDAREGFNRGNAVLGGSDSCVATHPSDMCVALAALDAQVLLHGPDGEREVRFVDFHRLPEDRPDLETELRPNELITAMVLPPPGMFANSTYRKVRDRSSYAFALVSAAAALERDQDGGIADVRLALGGVGTKPWRAFDAEAVLRGGKATQENFRAAAETALTGAVGLAGNAFKIELAKRVIVAVLAELTGENA